MNIDLSNAVHYHLGAFPPESLNSDTILLPLAEAAAALAKYDVMLRQLPDSEILLSSLRRQEAVISSRMEGTVTTLEEVLSAEADTPDDESVVAGDYRHEAIEALAYSSAMKNAQYQLEQGASISESLIKTMHHQLLRFGRGSDLAPGQYKVDQNYLADRSKKKVLFVPVSPIQLQPHMMRLIEYIDSAPVHPLIKAAVSHVEFEALHPFNDGNGRMGRMLITLYLWQAKVISAPHFYVSEYFEEFRDSYIDRMRAVSASNEWTGWVQFFLVGLAVQARYKCDEIDRIQKLYTDMQATFKEVLSSKDFMIALNFMFEKPVFRTTNFAKYTGLKKATASRFLRLLKEKNLIRIIQDGAGRRAALYVFQPLLSVLRT